MSCIFPIDVGAVWGRALAFVAEELANLQATSGYRTCFEAVQQAQLLERYQPAGDQAAQASTAEADLASRVARECGGDPWQACRPAHVEAHLRFATIDGKACTPFRGDPQDPDCFAIIQATPEKVSISEVDKYGRPAHLSDTCR